MLNINFDLIEERREVWGNLLNTFRTALEKLDSFRVWNTVFRCINMALAGDNVLYTDRARSVNGNF